MSSDGQEKIKSAQHSTGRVATHGSIKEIPKDQKREDNTSVSPTVNVVLPESVETGFKAKQKRGHSKK